MTKRGLVVIAALAMVFSGGCGPKKTGDETSSGCRPRDLQVDVNSGTMDVYWKSNCDRLISGYNIYIAENPLVKEYPGSRLPRAVRPFNHQPYSGDTNPDDGLEHFIAEGLENGKKYYVSVRVVNPDLTVSKPSNEVMAVCGPSGEIELSVRYRSEHDGFSFERGEYVRADAVDNDVYFFSDSDGDYLNSPAKLTGFLKENLMAKLSLKGTFRDIRGKISQVTESPDEQKISVGKGDWLLLRTPEGTNAVVNVLEIAGDGQDRRIKLFFTYNPLPGEMTF
ncbi:MAG: fibronectin type III domain-containing protein [Candidatus Zixiibacteriota bacterium]|nr:MAG: fibronectin type III domain-containing protein [candidate division Zixibacteria bacterium]